MRQIYCKVFVIVSLTLIPLSIKAQYVHYSTPSKLSGEVNDTFEFVISIDTLKSIDMYSFESEIEYDPNLLEITVDDISVGEMLQNGFFDKAISSDYKIRVAFARTTPIQTTGSVLIIRGKFIKEGENQFGIKINKMSISDNSYASNITLPHNIPVQVGTVTSTELSQKHNETSLLLYPNPFNSHTTIKYELKNADYVELNLYSIHGAKIQQLYKGFQSDGIHSLSIDASSLVSGVYYIRLSSQTDNLMYPLTLVK